MFVALRVVHSASYAALDPLGDKECSAVCHRRIPLYLRTTSVILYGMHIPFDAATLRTLYQTREAYLREVKCVVEELVKGTCHTP